MALGKGIPVINGFDLNSKLPLDSRTVADTKENMNKLVTDGSVGDGQLCYCKADKKLYVLKDNVWSEVGGGGGGIATANVNSETYQLDTSSLTTKDQYVLASADDGAGSIRYIPLQTYFFNDGYFNKEVKMQISNHDFRLTLTDLAFQSDTNYVMKCKNTNVDFTNTLDSIGTWKKLGNIKYIAIEEQDMVTGEYYYAYLEISGGGSSIFDITPYLTSETSMSIEGYNALREFVTSNKGGMIKMATNDSDAFYYNCMSISLHDIMFSVVGTVETSTTMRTLIVADSGNVQTVETNSLNIPSFPSDLSKTYTLQAVNGVLTWNTIGGNSGVTVTFED